MEEPEATVIRVLLIEDETSVAKSIIRLLARDGFQVDHVHSIADSRPHFAAKTHDVVLLDLSLPDSSGVDTVRKVRAQTLVPIVIFTGMSVGPDDKLALDAIAAGADFYCEKTGEIGEVRRALRMSLLRKQLTASVQGPQDICSRIAKVERDGALVCFCLRCDRIAFMVESNIGPLVCPHCAQRTLLQWGKAKIFFEPELPAKFLAMLR